jgi:crotonobetainyl-CoA:carnitine CoA-transferase CaiB-like acyl-CoA transferase
MIYLTEKIMPLDDIRVVDMTHVWYGPWCTMMLAYLGAEVIRVEPPWGAIDRLSQSGVYGGVPYTFHHLNLNKKDITINTKEEEGLELLKEIIKISDVVVQNMSVGAMERMGLGYDVLKETNPKIIYAALSGFGQTGPYKDRKSYAMIAEAMSSHSRLTGDDVDPDGPPIEMAMAYGDIGPGTMAAFGIVSALRHRDRTGEGQMLDLAQLDIMTAFNPGVTLWNLGNVTPAEMRKQTPGGGIGGLFKAKDGEWVRIGAYSPSAVDTMRSLFDDPEFNKEKLEKYVTEHTSKEVVDLLVQARLPVAPIYHTKDTANDPHLHSRNMYVEIEHPRVGKYNAINFPVKMSMTQPEIKRHAPLLGQDNKYVICELLGKSDEYYEDLKKKGIVAWT